MTRLFFIGMPVAPNYRIGLLRRKKKMADGSPTRRCMSHSPFNGADFCEEGTGNSRSSGEQIWKSIWNEHKLLRGSYLPYIPSE